MKNKDWQIFIQLLKEIAEEKGVTQQEISEKTGYSQPNISRIFSMRYTPRLDVFLAIAEAVGVNFFFEDKDGNTDLSVLFERAMTVIGRRSPEDISNN